MKQSSEDRYQYQDIVIVESETNVVRFSSFTHTRKKKGGGGQIKQLYKQRTATRHFGFKVIVGSSGSKRGENIQRREEHRAWPKSPP